jgi:hypothetical protein
MTMLETCREAGISGPHRDSLHEIYRQHQWLLRCVSRLSGAVEDYLDGESQGNVTGLRQALAFTEQTEDSNHESISVG